MRDGLRLFSIEAALIKVPEAFFAAKPIEAQVALATVREPSGLLHRLLAGGNSVVAGRLMGAFRRIGRPEMADEIRAAMTGAGYDVRESDPFVPGHEFGRLDPGIAPIVGRIQSLWDSMRSVVVGTFPSAPGLPADRKAYLQFVDNIYHSDAYHSLSIEGYRVTPALIERVRSGDWNPESNDAGSAKPRCAGGARLLAGIPEVVKQSVEKIIGGANAGALVRTTHRDWYRELLSALGRRGDHPGETLLPATAMTSCSCAPRAMCRRAGRRCAMRCRRFSICLNQKLSHLSEPYSVTGSLGTYIPTWMAMVEWLAF